MDSNASNSEVLSWYDYIIPRYNSLAMLVEKNLSEEISARKITIHSVDYRIKNKDSFLEKCKRKKYKNIEQDMTDIAGVRVITNTTQEIDEICKIVEDLFNVDRENSVNKAEELDVNRVGYLSVHYIISLGEKQSENEKYKELNNLKCEIQIRTILQHAWAEIEHDREYKFVGTLPTEISRRFYLVAAVLEMVDREFQRLSDDVDEYRKRTQQEVANGNISNTHINAVTIVEYMNRHCANTLLEKTLGDEDKQIISELSLFGIKVLRDFDELLTMDIVNPILEFVTKDNGESNFNYTFIIRSVMIIKDTKKYFNEAWCNNWLYESKNTIDFWINSGADKDVILENILTLE